MNLPATFDEPLVLADGTKIDPTNGKIIKDRSASFVSVPNSSEAQQIIAKTRRTVSELPMPPQKLSGIALVAFYTLYGLDDRDISIALDGQLTVNQIAHIRKLDPYLEFMSAAKQNLLNTETQMVRDLFEKHAPQAAAKIINLAESDSEVLAFKASQDVLDRAGHRPADIVEHRHRIEDSLNIVVIKRDESVQTPMIDVRPEPVEEGLE